MKNKVFLMLSLTLIILSSTCLAGYAENSTASFNTIQTNSGIIQFILDDLHIGNGVLLFSIMEKVGDDNSHASNHVYFNGELAGSEESDGDNAEENVSRKTLNFVNYAPGLSIDKPWENFRMALQDAVFTLSYTDADGAIQTWTGKADGYEWAYVFHNQDISEYDKPVVMTDGTIMNPNSADESGLHTMGNSIELSLKDVEMVDGQLRFSLIEKVDLMSDYGGAFTGWVNGEARDGGAGTVSFDSDGNPQPPEDGKFVYSDNFAFDVPGLSEKSSAAILSLTFSRMLFELNYLDVNGEIGTWSDTIEKPIIADFILTE